MLFYYITMQAVRQMYHSYQEDKQNQLLVFEEDSIVLDLPDEPKVVDGWEILPLTYPQVKMTS